MSKQLLIAVAAAMLLASSVDAAPHQHQNKPMKNKICTYFSILPGCGKKAPKAQANVSVDVVDLPAIKKEGKVTPTNLKQPKPTVLQQPAKLQQTSAVSEEEEQVQKGFFSKVGQSVCNTASWFPGCGAYIDPAEKQKADKLKKVKAKKVKIDQFFEEDGNALFEEEEDMGLQAMNCVAYPNTQWCKKMIASLPANEQEQFWEIIAKSNPQLFEEDEEEMGLQMVNCLEHFNTPICQKTIASWSEEEQAQFWQLISARNGGQKTAGLFEEEEEMGLQMVNCVQYPNTATCQKVIASWSAEEQEQFWKLVAQQNSKNASIYEEEEEEMGLQMINCLDHPNSAICVKTIESWSSEEQQQFWKLVAQRGTNKVGIYEEEEDLGLQMVNCVEFPNTETCKKTIESWSPEEQKQFWQIVAQRKKNQVYEEEELGLQMVNCVEHHATPLCQKTIASWSADEQAQFWKLVAQRNGGAKTAGIYEEEEEMGLQMVNCVQYPNTAICQKTIASWSAEEQEQFWKLVAQQNSKNASIYEEEQLQLPSFLKKASIPTQTSGRLQAINCAVYKDAPWCVAKPIKVVQPVLTFEPHEEIAFHKF